MNDPVIIIGAPRSGTNMLRDVLCEVPGYRTWPCDEINYIWRHGNVRVPSDEFTVEMARPDVKKYIRRCFEKQDIEGQTLIEKTCANSLRVDFVDAVIPNARYIFIVRDGFDVVSSAQKRWTAKADYKYLLKKTRFVPPSDLPYYGLRYFSNRFYRLLSKEKRLAFWGPQLTDTNELLQKYSLEEVCAIQWKRCVESSLASFDGALGDKCVRLKYEDFVANPVTELSKILDFLGSSYSPEMVEHATSGVSTGSLGKGRDHMEPKLRESLNALISDTLETLGYE